MDVLNMVITVPSWAYDFCYYYLAVVAAVIVFTVYMIIRLLLLPASIAKGVPVTEIVINLVLSAVVTGVLTMMQFWICRAALAPTKIEKFAVTCGKNEDCTAVAGTQPEGSLCTCGKRGLCGGCVFNSHMESGSSDQDLAGF
jgi:hypothetical protein